eukprot:COSAG06_NODE_67460_length_252_cov_0.483660_1_plen_32_part_10
MIRELPRGRTPQGGKNPFFLGGGGGGHFIPKV